MTALNDFDRLLRQTIGLDVASIGAPALERAVQERQRACSVEDTHEYLKHVRGSEAELQALIETVIIPETWFFRDRGAFAGLVRFVLDEWLPLHPGGCLRLMSLPCSTGEEPYSMAMGLLDAGVLPGGFRIDAIDICERSLAHARRAVYGKRSFRGNEVSYRERHFTPQATGHLLSDAVRQQVHFQQANLLSPGFLPGTEIYDVIFCRNMLIYFDSEAQDRAVCLVERLLVPNGMLFVGSSESGVLQNHPFSSAKAPMAFAFRKEIGSTPKRPAAVTKVRRPPRTPFADAAPVQSRYSPAEIKNVVQSVSGADEALKLADQGRFAEASQCCEDYLQRHGPSAEVFHVLGLVRDAGGNATDAAAYYRKALYLDPRHRDVMVHLALLMEKQGQKSEAQALWNRVRRLAPHGAE